MKTLWNRDDESVHTIYIDTKQYGELSPSSNDTPWSMAVNFLVSFKLSDYVDANIALFVEYDDIRGKHKLVIDHHKVEFDSNLLFSNLVQLPVRGAISEMCLKLVGVPKNVDVDIELVHVQVENQRCFVDSQPAFHKEVSTLEQKKVLNIC